jgi:hypothetical protein
VGRGIASEWKRILFSLGCGHESFPWTRNRVLYCFLFCSVIREGRKFHIITGMPLGLEILSGRRNRLWLRK